MPTNLPKCDREDHLLQSQSTTRASSKAPDWDYPTGPAISSDLEDDSDGHIHLAGMKKQELPGQLLLEAVCDLLAPATLAERLSSLPWTQAWCLGKALSVEPGNGVSKHTVRKANIMLTELT